MPQNYQQQPEKINVRGVYFDNVTMDEAFEKAKALIAEEGFKYMVTPNSEIVEACVEDHTLYNVMNGASLVIPDGIGVVYASKILKTPLKEKVPGCELGEKLIEYAAKEGIGVYFLGAGRKTAEHEAVYTLAGRALEKKYPGLVWHGHDGYFAEDEIDDIISDIDGTGAKLLFVCLGAPKQEKWMSRYGGKCRNITLAAGLGGSLDVFAGVAERAPDFYLKHNLEWFYRLKKNPSRIGRMMKLPKFLAGTVIKGNKVK